MAPANVSVVLTLIGLTIAGTYAFGGERAAATTTKSPGPKSQVLLGHSPYVYVVRSDGCYKIHVDSHLYNSLRHGQHVHADHAALITMAEKATEVHEIDHHQIDRENSQIQTLCQDLPVFMIAHTAPVGK